MLKRFFFAVAPLMLIAGTVVADDNLLSAVAKLDADKPTATETAEMDDLGQADVDALLGEGEEQQEEAIAACFRRIGYGYGRGYGRGYGYGYRSYGHCSYRFYRPTCYPSYHYRPVYNSCYTSYYTPIYSNYWGCW
jgi:hypothetical protein